MKRIYFLFIVLVPHFMSAQTKTKDTVTRRASIHVVKKGNQVSLKPITPPLQQIAGAPKANYSYFWEFGDGQFSKQENPIHTYKKKKTHKINLSVTNNYDNGKPPKTRPTTASIEEISDHNFSEIASLHDSITLKMFCNRDPIPEEDIIVVLSYKNPLNYVSNGKIYLFYNDKEFKNDNFELIETRSHFEEKEVFENAFVYNKDSNNSNLYTANLNSDNYILNEKNKEDDLDVTLLDCKSKFRNVKIFEYNNMEPSETRNMFFSFKTTPEMIKDTTAIVKMRSVYVPDRNYKNHKKKTLEMQIVTSHDPNRMSSNAFFMNYRLVRFKKIYFKTKFQNDGEGPARTIRLETDIPEMFNKQTLEIVDMYPKCPICPKNEIVTYSCLDTIIKKSQIHFTFKNIYLPGSNQKNVIEKDSTKGFVKYTIKFNKDFHKKTTRSRTAIYFDKNEPVVTNYATTRFQPGLSIGAKAGYNFFPKLNDSKSYFTSITLSPYKSYRWYWQIELQNNLHQYISNPEIIDNFSLTANGVKRLERTTIISKYDNVSTEVPILIRYNINNYFGLGAGINLGVNLHQSRSSEIKTELFETDQTSVVINRGFTSEKNSTSFNAFKSGILIDFTGGFSRIGPSLGVRYVINSKTDFNYFQLYALWKF